ncbi:hypothetical protein LEMLEM_LOCUS12978 [Lemmus lemmus]
MMSFLGSHSCNSQQEESSVQKYYISTSVVRGVRIYWKEVLRYFLE